MGRRTKLTPKVQERIVSALASGNYAEAACAYGGITFQTFRNWMIRGQASRSGIYFEFFEAVTRAENEAEVLAVGELREAGKGDWRAILAFLERRYPDRWGRKDRVEIERVIRREAERLAEETGLNVDEIVAAAEAIAASG